MLKMLCGTAMLILMMCVLVSCAPRQEHLTVGMAGAPGTPASHAGGEVPGPGVAPRLHANRPK